MQNGGPEPAVSVLSGQMPAPFRLPFQPPFQPWRALNLRTVLLMT